MKLSPLIKGLITSAIMIGIFYFLIYLRRENADPRLGVLVYITYALGVCWAVLSYRFSPAFSGKFGDTFNQGFRCFIVVILMMAVFYLLFSITHPEIAKDSALAYQEHLIKENLKTPPEISEEVAKYEKQYTLKLVSGAIFGYLIIGAGVTAIVSALVYRRK